MTTRIYVVPAEAGAGVPPHPFDGPLPAQGGWWTNDQFTCRRIVEGLVVPAEPPAPKQADEPETHTADDAGPDAIAGADGEPGPEKSAAPSPARPTA